MKLPFIEPYKTKMVEPVYKSTPDQREKWITESGFNLFNLKAEQVTIDLLTDSGTGAMSDRQWSALMMGDESYAGASSYYNLKNAITEITGFSRFLPVHQGRAAENVLFSVLVKEGDLVPGNSHFDTTKGHIEFRKAVPVDCTVDIASDTTINAPFKGNVDLEKLERILKNNPPDKIACIIVTITNNTAGGQPVSMENIKSTGALAKKYGVKFFLDSARFAENAWFIKTREAGYADKDIREIVREMFSYSDGMTMSSKKDAIVNMGGFIGFRDEEIFRKASAFNIIYEGFITYGGMSGRDMNALARGLYEGTDYEFLSSRIGQVARLGSQMKDYGIPVLEPFGGHAIFIDAQRFFPHIPLEEFPAQSLAVEIYVEGGIRGSEIGTLMADRDPVTRQNRYTGRELVRLAIPRRVYSDNHMDYVAAAVKNVLDRRNSVKHGFRIIQEAPILRHFTIGLERIV
ncbi:MAG TPA: tryptophanase [Bacteroidales bacterium]|nr:tryptophanase [Bacteroidales bacterium]HPJ59258.1 tryptophanase [Bacteroidales bacterium]HPR11064.1 tryptophanase [Bacteroidales bacterium]HRW84409.1 tryptophanase [Bacteroidales bacterium]